MSYAAPDPAGLSASGKFSREKPERRSLRWASHKASLRYAADLGPDWRLSLWAGLTRTKFDGEEPLFLKRRKDRTCDVGLTIANRALAWEGYLPVLTLN